MVNLFTLTVGKSDETQWQSEFPTLDAAKSRAAELCEADHDNAEHEYEYASFIIQCPNGDVGTASGWDDYFGIEWDWDTSARV